MTPPSLHVEQRIKDEQCREFIIAYPCGCAQLLRTYEQIAYCPQHANGRQDVESTQP